MSTIKQTAPAIPGPKGYPLVGIIPKIGRDPLAFFVRMMEEYGDLVYLNMGFRGMYLVSEAEGLKYILQDNNRNYGKGYDVTKPLIGNGLVTSEGEFWRRQRRLMQPMFHRQKINQFSEVMVDTTNEIIASWEANTRQSAELDVAAEMTRITQQVIARTMFSTDVGDQTDVLCEAFDNGLEYLNQHMFNPLPFIDKLPTATNRRFKHSLALLNEVMYGLINARRNSGDNPGDLLSMLLQARDEETGEGMSDEQIRDEVLTIFFAGHETTASTLSWTWYLLSQYPEVEARMVAELADVLGGRMPTFEDFPRLVYTRRVVDEVLRLYPPAWMFARTVLEDDEVCGYHVPAGSMLMLSPYVTHRNPAYWDAPETFDPDRFLPERVAERPKYAYFPFGGGPRLCIGRDFALMEAVLVIAVIAQQYQLRLAPGREVHAQPIATLRPRPGVFVNISRR
jgi:cytochrome P450